MMVDVTRKTYYSLVAHQRIAGFSCYSYMKLQVCTVIYYCHYRQTKYKSTIWPVQNASVKGSFLSETLEDLSFLNHHWPKIQAKI